MGDEGAQLDVRGRDLLAQVLVALGQALECEFDSGGRGGQIGAGTVGGQAPYQLGGGQRAQCFVYRGGRGDDQ
ncbi:MULTISPECIES: hypothetical protein [Streptomyces]|uniref:Uncharacterized protein n=1 Tax=Streptomyces mordarskii TaxID=1226758 RepID=A0ABP3PQP5_9ACTN|nr:hypothetical protein OG751_00660 [Streptomyces antimycoticus]WTB02891.1 hypothetical protein OG546_00610 [Streptomyces antimycoticus]